MYSMILKILCFYNKKIECFTNPIYDDHDSKDAAIQLKRSLMIEKDLDKISSYKNLMLYHLGEFDDQTGKMTLLGEPDMILDCSKIMEAREDYVASEEIHRN